MNNRARLGLAVGAGMVGGLFGVGAAVAFSYLHDIVNRDENESATETTEKLSETREDFDEQWRHHIATLDPPRRSRRQQTPVHIRMASALKHVDTKLTPEVLARVLLFLPLDEALTLPAPFQLAVDIMLDDDDVCARGVVQGVTRRDLLLHSRVRSFLRSRGEHQEVRTASCDDALLQNLARFAVLSEVHLDVVASPTTTHNSSKNDADIDVDLTDLNRLSPSTRKKLRTAMTALRCDVPRTILDDDVEDVVERERRRGMVRRVLSAFALKWPRVGYTQGMGFVVAHLLKLMQWRDDPMTEAVALGAMEMFDRDPRYGMRRIFGSKVPGLALGFVQLRALLRQHLPTLLYRMEDMGVHPMHFATEWIATAFTYAPLPEDVKCRVFDLFLARGWPALFTCGLALLELLEQDLCAQEDMTGVIAMLKRLGDHPAVASPAFAKALVAHAERAFAPHVTHDALDDLHLAFLAQETPQTSASGRSDSGLAQQAEELADSDDDQDLFI
ncbi:MAG: hypothetical protein MHM6MM_002166 [Cercozoa sp. M6MM]